MASSEGQNRLVVFPYISIPTDVGVKRDIFLNLIYIAS